MASLYVIRGKDNGQHFAIRGGNATIGRESNNQIQLRDTEVSRQHARIVRTGPSEFEIVDNGSSNGTFVNSRRIQSQILRSGDRVQVGRTLLIFTGGPEPYSTKSINAGEIGSRKDPAELSQIRSSIHSQSVLLGMPDDKQHSSARPSPPAPAPETQNWEIVYQVSQAIHRTIDLNDLLTQVLDLIFDWIDCHRGCILMLDDISGQLTPICSRDLKTTDAFEPSPQNKRLRISQTILDHVVHNKEGVLTGNAQDDSRWQNADSVASLGVYEAICVPMLGRYGFVGAIYIDTSMSAGNFAEKKGESSFTEEHLKLMMAIAGQAALAVEDTQFYRAMVQSERLAVMGQTIANLSHHVKNILQGISGGNYLVEEGISQEDLTVVQKGWGIVQRNQARISEMVMDMLSFSKEREPQLQAQDLRTLIDELVSLLQSRAEDRKIEIGWQRPAEPIVVEFEQEAMHRAVLNVLSNALDACSQDPESTRQGRVEIQIGAQDQVAYIVIQDNGNGISDEDQPKVFAPFESTKGSRGTGLGLPVTQKIIREHGGDITFESTPTIGTCFTMTWPAQATDDSPPTMQTESE